MSYLEELALTLETESAAIVAIAESLEMTDEEVIALFEHDIKIRREQDNEVLPR